MMNLVFDMDGVLAKYDWNDYRGDDPNWLKQGARYFFHRPPDYKMLAVLNVMQEKRQKHKISLFVASNVPPYKITDEEFIPDKINWLHKFAPSLDTDCQFYPVKFPETKHNVIKLQKIHEQRDVSTDELSLSQSDVLIDDRNKNLIEWSAAGGTAIKYCNGVNSPNKNEPEKSWKGLHLTQNMSAKDIVGLLTYLSKSL